MIIHYLQSVSSLPFDSLDSMLKVEIEPTLRPMPFVQISGLDVPSDDLWPLTRAIREEVMKIKELQIGKPEDTGVYFVPHEVMGAQGPVSVVIDLFAKAERTLEVQNRLAEAVGTLLAKVGKQTIFSRVNLIDRDKIGYWDSRPKNP